MRRWLGIILTIGLFSTPASAQVFKPKSKKAAAAKKEPASDQPKKAAKKQPRAGATKKRPAKKKSAASDRARPDEETAEPESKTTGKDYVKIWDDDDIE
ncbi:MAG TPA: hypothetical protein VIV40_43615 [Kofleriaceae bacterium]